MQEYPLQRSIRRQLSKKLTETINEADHYPKVRIAVLNSLSMLWGRLESLKDELRKSFGLHPEQELFYFYMKGGNAYACVIEPNGLAATKRGGGASDWDCQIVVDPWAPLPLQTNIYAAIEDLVRDEFRNCAVEIAKLKPEFTSPVEVTCQHPILPYAYQITLDKPQTIRQGLSHSQTGLWLDTRHKMCGTSELGGILPGMIFNDAITPFQLFRLGYTWHAEPLHDQILLEEYFRELQVDEGRPPQQTTIAPQIERPLLMELIDVTLPRRNTVEAIEIWQEFATKKIEIESKKVSVGIGNGDVELPLPPLAYHFIEQAVMLCEVATGVSKSADKVGSRFERLAKIYNAAPAEPALERYRAEMAAMAGIPVTQLAVRVSDATVDTILAKYGADVKLKFGSGTPEYMALNMMYQVASRRIAHVDVARQEGRTVTKLITGALVQQYAVAEIGASDDLALFSTLQQSGYFDMAKFPACGIPIAFYARIKNPYELNNAAQYLLGRLEGRLKNLIELASKVVDFRLTPPQKARKTEENSGIRSQESQIASWILSLFLDKQIRLERRNHTTYRPTGISREVTLVVFADDRAVACISLTSASAAQAPFMSDPLQRGAVLASVVDMAEQRKVVAALTKDFCIRSALAQQLALLNRLFPSV